MHACMHALCQIFSSKLKLPPTIPYHKPSTLKEPNSHLTLPFPSLQQTQTDTIHEAEIQNVSSENQTNIKTIPETTTK
jgi:hypothetical protein